MGDRKPARDAGTPKCGQVNVLGHERMYRVIHVEFPL